MNRYLLIVPAALALVWVAGPAMATEPTPTETVAPETQYAVGLYCYEKLSDAPAAWENSGEQTLAAVKVGTEGWSEAEKRDLCAAPLEACEPSKIATQEDWVSFVGEFTFPEHITYPTDNIGWPPIYKAAHTDLTQTAKDCTVVPPVVPPVTPPVTPPSLAHTPGGENWSWLLYGTLSLFAVGLVLKNPRRLFR